MKYILVLILILFSEKMLNAQSRVIINNDGYIVFRNSIYLIVNNSNSNAITTTGTGGNIVTESEYNRVKWVVGTNTGTYTVPFTKSPGNKIPLSVSVLTTGIGSGSVLFSTYGGATWDNSTYLPSGVTNIGSITGGTNNSAHVVDRFWIVDAQGYSTKPVARINFTYLDAEWAAAGNSISESSLFAQRFNSTLNDWGDWLGPYGTANTAANTVSSGTIASGDFFRSWTLVNQGFSLPIELLYFKISCGENKSKTFEWATATEKNNRYFHVEGSADAINWKTLGETNAAGNSTTTQFYSQVINLPEPDVYYRLKQTDYSGAYKYSDIIFKDCASSMEKEMSLYPNPGNGYFNLKLVNFENETIDVKITDAIGRLIEERTIIPTSQYYVENFTIDAKTNGLYIFTITSSTKVLTEKMMVNY